MSSFGRIIVHKHIANDSYGSIYEATLLVDVLCETYSDATAYDDIAILPDVRVGREAAADKILLCNRRIQLRNNC